MDTIKDAAAGTTADPVGMTPWKRIGANALLLVVCCIGGSWAAEEAEHRFLRGLIPAQGFHPYCVFVSKGDQILAIGMRLRYFQTVPPYGLVATHLPVEGPMGISPDGRRLYVLSANGVQVLNTDDLVPENAFALSESDKKKGFGKLALSADGKRIALAGAKYVVVLDAQTGERICDYNFERYADSVAFLSFADDDKKVITVWTQTLDYVLSGGRVIDVATGEVSKFIYLIGRAQDGRGIATASPDGRSVVYGRVEQVEDGQEVRIVARWLASVDVRTLQPRWATKLDVYAQHITFSPDGRYILVNGHPQVGNHAPCAYRIFDAAGGKLLFTMPVDTPGLTPPTPMGTFAFSPDGKTLATCPLKSADRNAPIALWDWTKIEAELLKGKQP